MIVLGLEWLQKETCSPRLNTKHVYQVFFIFNLKTNIMKAKNEMTDVSLEMDSLYGKVGTPELEAFQREAYACCVGQIIRDARHREKVSQRELAERIGVSQSYISQIEKGTVEPGAGMFYQIIEALGLCLNIVKPAN